MFYEVYARLFFSSEDEANDFYHDCELATAKSQIINVGSPTEEQGHALLILNNHDSDPNQPCDLVKDILAPRFPI